MAEQFVVLVEGMVTAQAVYGPFTDQEEAKAFASFASQEIDPATVRRLSSPVGELLAWRDMMKELGNG